MKFGLDGQQLIDIDYAPNVAEMYSQEPIYRIGGIIRASNVHIDT